MARLQKPRCFLVIAWTPQGTTPAEANRLFNDFVADRRLPLVLFHDHFIGELGGVAIFYVADEEERQALYNHEHLDDWTVKIHPLIYAHSPSALDEQIAYTLRRYREADWEQLRQESRPQYGAGEAEG